MQQKQNTGKGPEEVGQWEFTLKAGVGTVFVDFEQEVVSVDLSLHRRAPLMRGVDVYELEEVSAEVRNISSLLMEEEGFLSLKKSYGDRLKRVD